MLPFVIAGLFLVALVFSAYWHNAQNKRLVDQLRRELDKETAQWIGDFTWTRSYQLWAALACAMLFTAVTGWELYSARQTISDFDAALKKSVEHINKSRTQIAQMEQLTSHYPPLVANAPAPKPQVATAQPQPQPQPQVQVQPQQQQQPVQNTAQALPAPTVTQPVPMAANAVADTPAINPPEWPQNNNVTATQAQPAPQAQPAAQVPSVSVSAQAVDGHNNAATLAPSAQNVTIISGIDNINPAAPNDAQVESQLNTQLASNNNASTVQEIYNPEEMSSDKQSAMDSIKKRYETLLVNYLFLKKCGLINPQDYHAIISALAREMSSVNAPGRLEHDIMTAAKGSYDEMYAKSSCTDQETGQLHAQYNDYINAISQNLPTP
jgi:hypothetical protein